MRERSAGFGKESLNILRLKREKVANKVAYSEILICAQNSLHRQCETWGGSAIILVDDFDLEPRRGAGGKLISAVGRENKRV